MRKKFLITDVSICKPRTAHGYMDIYTWTLPEICIHMQTFTYPEAYLRSENECKILYQVCNEIKMKKDTETHTLFLVESLIILAKATEKFLIYRLIPGHTCRIKAVNFLESECLFVLFVHQWILIHNFDFLL